VSAGWVYVLETGRAGVLKIGHTTRTPRDRGRELEADPAYRDFAPFTTVWCMPVAHAHAVEARVHRMLGDRRVRGELFRVDLEEVKLVAMAAAQQHLPALPQRSAIWQPNYRPSKLRRLVKTREARRLAHSLAVLGGLAAAMMYLFP
jgi:hypothetical protein